MRWNDRKRTKTVFTESLHERNNIVENETTMNKLYSQRKNIIIFMGVTSNSN